MSLANYCATEMGSAVGTAVDGQCNLVRHDAAHSPFSALFGQFSLGYSPETPMGLGALAAKGALCTYDLANPTLAVGILGESLICPRRQELRCWPWLTEETGSSFLGEGNRTVEVFSRTCFADERTAVFECRISGFPEGSQPVLFGRAIPDQRLAMIGAFPSSPAVGREMRVTACDRTCTILLDPSTTGSPLPYVEVTIEASEGWHAELCGDAPFGESSIVGPWYRFVPNEVAESAIGVFVVKYLARNGHGSQTEPTPPRKLDEFQVLVAGQEERWRSRIDQSDSMRARSSTVLLRTGMKSLDGEFAGSLASLCTSSCDDFSSLFFWDSLFSSVAIAHFDPEFAKGAIQSVFTRQCPRDGSSPERKWNYTVPERMAQQSPQPPIATWAVREVHRIAPDFDFLDRIYPKLSANHRFWQEFADTDRDGLSEYRWSGQAGDNSPLWDPYGSFESGFGGCTWLPPVASVSLNSFLYSDARHLEALCIDLDRSDDASRWSARKHQLANSLNQICYVSDDFKFYDFDHHLQEHRRAETFFQFWPLIVGLPMPGSAETSMVQSLLDPAAYFGSVPFPSVAYHSAQFDPNGYWRGKSWPHITYWLIQTLWTLGRYREAEDAASRALGAFNLSPGYLENQTASLSVSTRAGFPDYNWGAAACYLLAKRSYRDPLALTL